MRPSSRTSAPAASSPPSPGPPWPAYVNIMADIFYVLAGICYILAGMSYVLAGIFYILASISYVPAGIFYVRRTRDRSAFTSSICKYFKLLQWCMQVSIYAGLLHTLASLSKNQCLLNRKNSSGLD
jgi:hypothetical protein